MTFEKKNNYYTKGTSRRLTDNYRELVERYYSPEKLYKNINIKYRTNEEAAAPSLKIPRIGNASDLLTYAVKLVEQSRAMYYFANTTDFIDTTAGVELEDCAVRLIGQASVMFRKGLAGILYSATPLVRELVTLLPKPVAIAGQVTGLELLPLTYAADSPVIIARLTYRTPIALEDKKHTYINVSRESPALELVNKQLNVWMQTNGMLRVGIKTTNPWGVSFSNIFVSGTHVY